MLQKEQKIYNVPVKDWDKLSSQARRIIAVGFRDGSAAVEEAYGDFPGDGYAEEAAKEFKLTGRVSSTWRAFTAGLGGE